ncbi:MAG: homoserine kinase [Coriobacteriia bacterium]|nr:homoserine kinase [Coriobacteriia bacterium]
MRVRVPASSANLGPGYDSFGLALALHNEFEAEFAESWAVEVGGEGAGRLETGAGNQVALAMARVFAEIGRRELAADITCHNGIPVGRGLGSSSAAIVGGLVLGDALTGAHLGEERILEIAAEIEGHADNVAAALYGGFTVTLGGSVAPQCARIDPAGGVAAVLVLGEGELPTSESRDALPAAVPHSDASANAGRAALVALGLALGEPGFTQAGLRDAIHERYRSRLVPDLDAVRSLFTAAGVGPAVLSGAGPTIVAPVQADDDARALERAREYSDDLRPMLAGIGRTRVIALSIDRGGAVLL